MGGPGSGRKKGSSSKLSLALKNYKERRKNQSRSTNNASRSREQNRDTAKRAIKWANTPKSKRKGTFSN